MADKNENAKYDECIRECMECAMMCAKCSRHCLGMGGEHGGQSHQSIMRDCAEICTLAAGFMARASDHAPHVCGECAEICNACAESCGRLSGGDRMMDRCAEICRRCARSCEEMSLAGSRA